MGEPDHSGAWRDRGNALQQVKRFDEAVLSYDRAVALNPGDVEAFNNRGNALQGLKRFDEALASYDRALALKPHQAETFYNRGITLHALRRLDEAVASYTRAVALKPDFAEAFSNRGYALIELNRFDEALANCDRAITLKPEFAEAFYNRGVALRKVNRSGDALVSFGRALAIRPGFAEAIYALVELLLIEGHATEALRLARHALAASETHETKSLIATCLRSRLVHPGMGDVRDLLIRALSEPWEHPAELAPTCVRFLPLNDAIRVGIGRATKAWPNLPPPEELAQSLADYANDRLFRALLESTPICDVELERFTTGLRFAMLAVAQSSDDGALAEPTLSLYCAIARQCFINDYAFVATAAEMQRVSALRDEIVAALASGAAIPTLSLVAVAAYMPLCTLAGAESLLSRVWPEAVSALLEQQVRAPIEERHLCTSIKRLTAIDDTTSVAVRAQYEENPYPRWVKVPAATEAESIDAYIRKMFPLSRFVELGKPGGLDILVAGCGTGRQSIEIARQFKAAQVLAVDLSLASLGYAQRQSGAVGLNNISYAQADLLALPSLERAFDVITASGVLHHLADPFAAWRVLLSMLRPGGLMFLGLYSEIARREIVAARDFIAERRFYPTADDIRRCRQELCASAETSVKNVTSSPDFFSISGCRDLLFHVQEHRLALPDIAAFIAANNLQFLGFALDPLTRRNYARRFPRDPAMTDMAQWHQYEIENPGTFIGCYQFWVQKLPPEQNKT